MRNYDSQLEPDRDDRLEAIRRRVAEGTFDSPERMAAAVSDMYDREFDPPRKDASWQLDFEN